MVLYIKVSRGRVEDWEWYCILRYLEDEWRTGNDTVYLGI